MKVKLDGSMVFISHVVLITYNGWSDVVSTFSKFGQDGKNRKMSIGCFPQAEPWLFLCGKLFSEGFWVVVIKEKIQF